MHIRSLVICGFTKYDNTTLVFPKKGIVLVTGPNGAGKSTIPEAVSMVCWNKPLRRKTGRKALRLWRRNDGELMIKTDRVSVHRTAKGKLKWSLANGAEQQYESATKAQVALESVIGEHQLWSRSRVFSSSDATHFTLAKDSERKRLLELVLRLEVFDEAYKECSHDHREAEKKLEACMVDIMLLGERLQMLQEQLDEVPETTDPPVIYGDPVSMRTAERVKAKLHKKQEEYDAATAAARELAEEVQPFAAAKARADAKVERMLEDVAAASQGRCASCGAKLPKERHSRAKKRLTLAREAADQASDELRAARHTVKAAQDRAERARAAADEAGELLADVERWQVAAEAGRRKRYELGLRIEETQDKIDTLQLEYSQGKQLVAELKATLAALGLAGIRSHMLGAALAGIEAVANAWLARFALSDDTAITVKLEPYSEKPSGAIKDSISLELYGVAESETSKGGGQDYGQLSNGERRRIDVAFMLAFAEVESGASGFDTGTLFFDEVLDALDEEGREAALEILLELAESACVVVITHNKSLISTLVPHAAATWQVEGGRVNDRSRNTNAARSAGAK